MRRFSQSGSPAPAHFGGHRRPILEPHEALVRGLLDARPDNFLVEIYADLRRRGIVVGATSTVSRCLRRAGLTHKKRMARPVRKWCLRGTQNGLHQRIRSRGTCPGQDGVPRTLVLIKVTALSAIFCARVSGCRINRRQAISRPPPIDLVTADAGAPIAVSCSGRHSDASHAGAIALARTQHRPGDARQLAGERHHRFVLVYSPE